MTRPRKLYVKSFGCQMNVYDSHRMADMLVPEGFAETAHIEDADLVILNTCHIREKAADKVYSELGRMRALKAAAARDGRRLTVAVAGCVAQAEGEEIIRRAPRQRLRHRAGRLRQVLHLLCRALHAWRRGVAAGDEDRRRSRAIGRRRRARSHVDRAERQCLPRRRTRRGGLDAWTIAGARC